VEIEENVENVVAAPGSLLAAWDCGGAEISASELAAGDEDG
jgi:hypothetical protein